MNEERVTASIELVDRLQRYSRYMALIAEQLEALHDDDSERLRRLNEQRQMLETEMAGTPESENSGIPAPLRIQEDLTRGLAELESRLQTDLWTEERWNRISEGTLKSARVVPAARIGARAYPVLDDRANRVDRRF